MGGDCPLCRDDGGLLIWRSDWLRLVRVTDTPEHPVFYRLILNRHVAEFSELAEGERQVLMDAVCRVERLLLASQPRPAKINLASLGNVVPHLHWHLIARYADDAQFPAPIWAPAQRGTPEAQLALRRAALPALDQALALALSG